MRLHDMQLTGLDYRVRDATLVLRFIYDDPEWTPPEARATPIAVFALARVTVWQWEDDADLFDRPVEALDRHPPTNAFALETLNTTLLFSARRWAVHLEPLDRT